MQKLAGHLNAIKHLVITLEHSHRKSETPVLKDWNGYTITLRPSRMIGVSREVKERSLDLAKKLIKENGLHSNEVGGQLRISTELRREYTSTARVVELHQELAKLGYRVKRKTVR